MKSRWKYQIFSLAAKKSKSIILTNFQSNIHFFSSSPISKCMIFFSHSIAKNEKKNRNLVAIKSELKCQLNFCLPEINFQSSISRESECLAVKCKPWDKLHFEGEGNERTNERKKWDKIQTPERCKLIRLVLLQPFLCIVYRNEIYFGWNTTWTRITQHSICLFIGYW